MLEDLAALYSSGPCREEHLWKDAEALPVLQKQQQSPWERHGLRKLQPWVRGDFSSQEFNGMARLASCGWHVMWLHRLVTQNTQVLFLASQTAFLKRNLESKDLNSSENSSKVGPASFPAPLPLFLPTSVLPPQEEEKSFMEMFFKNMAVSSEKLHTLKLKGVSHEW